MHTCLKCGSMEINIKYDRRDDKLNLSCDRCGYSWQSEPLDKSQVIADEEEVIRKILP